MWVNCVNGISEVKLQVSLLTPYRILVFIVILSRLCTSFRDRPLFLCLNIYLQWYTILVYQDTGRYRCYLANSIQYYLNPYFLRNIQYLVLFLNILRIPTFWLRIWTAFQIQIQVFIEYVKSRIIQILNECSYFQIDS